jgi:hypothetical protein
MCIDEVTVSVLGESFFPTQRWDRRLWLIPQASSQARQVYCKECPSLPEIREVCVPGSGLRLNFRWGLVPCLAYPSAVFVAYTESSPRATGGRFVWSE